jgi:hypothetical protein
VSVPRWGQTGRQKRGFTTVKEAQKVTGPEYKAICQPP